MKNTKIRTSKGTTKITAPTIFNNNSLEKRTEAEVVFGVSGRNCQGSGICRVLPWTGKLTVGRPCTAFHTVLYAPEAGIVEAEVFFSGRCKKLVEYWITEKCFFMEEEYLLPQFISKNWETGPITLLQGFHGVAGIRGGARILFKYRKSRGLLSEKSGTNFSDFPIN